MMNVQQNMKPRYGLWASISVIGALLSLVSAFAYTGEELARDARVSISEARAIALKRTLAKSPMRNLSVKAEEPAFNILSTSRMAGSPRRSASTR